MNSKVLKKEFAILTQKGVAPMLIEQHLDSNKGNTV